MAQWLSVLAILLEDLKFSSQHTWASSNCLELQLQGIWPQRASPTWQRLTDIHKEVKYCSLS